MDLNDFNCNYLNKLLENISKEQKSVSYLEILMLIYWIIMSIIRQMNFELIFEKWMRLSCLIYTFSFTTNQNN